MRQTHTDSKVPRRTLNRGKRYQRTYCGKLFHALSLTLGETITRQPMALNFCDETVKPMFEWLYLVRIEQKKRKKKS